MPITSLWKQWRFVLTPCPSTVPEHRTPEYFHIFTGWCFEPGFPCVRQSVGFIGSDSCPLVLWRRVFYWVLVYAIPGENLGSRVFGRPSGIVNAHHRYMGYHSKLLFGGRVETPALRPRCYPDVFLIHRPPLATSGLFVVRTLSRGVSARRGNSDHSQRRGCFTFDFPGTLLSLSLIP